jgi:hypothetical protein
MSTHDDFHQEPVPPAPKKSGSKVLLIVGTIVGLGLVLCCGAPAIVYVVFKDAIMKKIKDTVDVTTEPAEVEARSEEVAHLDIPESYSPMSAVRLSFGVFTMKMIMYQGGANNQGGLVLMEMDQPGMDRKQMRDQMLQQMRQQQAQGGPGGMQTQIVAQTTETKMFKINGEDVEFDFVKGTQPGNSTVVRQITGTFRGRNGTALLMLIIPDSEYNEDAVIKLIKSIRVPGSDGATEVSAESTTDEDADQEEVMTEKEEGQPKQDESALESETTPEKSE